MKLSMMSYTMSRQQGFDLKTMLDVTVKTGMDGIDFYGVYDSDAKTLRAMCDDRGLKVVCYICNAPMNFPQAQQRKPALEAVKVAIDNALIMGAPVLMIPTPPGEGESRQSRRNNWIAGLNEAMPMVKAAGLELCVENFPGKDSPFVIADDLLEAIGKVPGLKVNYDNGNAATGEEPGASFTAVAPYVVHAHFKDWDRSDTPTEGYRPMLDGRYYKPALIGEGCVDHESTLRAMKAAGYDGYINIEYESDKYPAAEAVQRAADYLRGIMDGL